MDVPDRGLFYCEVTAHEDDGAVFMRTQDGEMMNVFLEDFSGKYAYKCHECDEWGTNKLFCVNIVIALDRPVCSVRLCMLPNALICNQHPCDCYQVHIKNLKHLSRPLHGQIWAENGPGVLYQWAGPLGGSLGSALQPRGGAGAGATSR